jgi:L-alanine-DL-glutamate epimerase-like enolase superfamily enzyme
MNMRICNLEARHYRIPLPAVLSDSIHGDMPDFELVTVRVATDQGIEGLGYTYTVGRGGSAIRSMIEHDLKPLVAGADPRATAQAWERMWWGINWVGRGGVGAFAMAAVDTALGHQRQGWGGAVVAPARGSGQSGEGLRRRHRPVLHA